MKDLFSSDKVLDQYDYVVIGSGFAALAFIDETLRLCPGTKILCVERGDERYAAHYERLLHSFREELGQLGTVPDVVPDECPWNLTSTTSSSKNLDACAGLCFLLGGRSNYWYGWCMKPALEQMRDYPAAMIEAATNPIFWSRASELLSMTNIDQLTGVFIDSLCSIIEGRLRDLMSRMPTRVDIRPAFFSNADEASVGFARYSVADRLRKFTNYSGDNKDAPLDILLNHTVTKLGYVKGTKCVDTIYTEKGRLNLANLETKVILCAGAIPNAMILLNSFPHVTHTIGKTISGHFRSHIFAKVPISAFVRENEQFIERKKWGLAAKVICGCDEETGQQYHIQLSAFYCPHYEGRYDEIVSNLPRYGAAPVEKHIKGLKHDVLISCATLGELSEDNQNSWLRSIPPRNNISEIELQFSLNGSDKRLWDLMDLATFQAVEALALEPQDVEYWSERLQGWIKQRPLKAERRSKMLVHEAGLTPMGDQHHPRTVGEQFEVRGCENVFVTGAGILPTAGSWNPTLAICGFAQETARILAKNQRKCS